MMRQLIRKIIQTVSSERAYNWVAQISSHHRIQASPGYREAARYAMQALHSAGLEARIISYPAKPDQWYMSSKGFQEWECQGAQLRLVLPHEEVLADYQAEKLSLCPRSWPADFRDRPVDVVLLDRGADRAAYKGLDARGKILFIRGHVADYQDWAAQETGAIGFITDYLREIPGSRTRKDLPDALNYTSFWWQHSPDEAQVFGFTLSPSAGDRLEALCREIAAQNAENPDLPAFPQVKGFVDSRFYDGEIEVVEAFIPGETEEEILLLAHLCHPQSSANDNASGVAAGMEALCTIKQLLDSGEVPALKRGIRLLLMPEFTGTYPWLEELGPSGWARVLAGLNLDMVAARQGGGNGPLTLTGVPHALPSPVMDIAGFALKELQKQGPIAGADLGVPLFNSVTVGFSGGSDHFILSDPTIGIPTPMWGQWPDRGYHTSADDLSVIDPFLLATSTAFAASYALILANLSPQNLDQLLLQSRERLHSSLLSVLAEADLDGGDLDMVYQEYLHLLRHAKDCLDGYEKFFGSAEDWLEIKQRINREQRLLETMAEGAWQNFTEVHAPDFVYRSREVPPEYDYLPRRKYLGPLRKLEDYCIGRPERLAAWKALEEGSRKQLRSAGNFEALLQYNMDGQRSLFALAREAMLEAHDGSLEYAHAYVQFLSSLDLVEIL